MRHDVPMSENLPEAGFYYHYKHDPEGRENAYAYELIGVGHHTEEDCRTEDVYLAIYRPIYEAYVYKLGKLYDVRPLSMFMETVEKDGQIIPRFTRIVDPELIERLKRRRDEMYL
jgi:hypothetical protein